MLVNAFKLTSNDEEEKKFEIKKKKMASNMREEKTNLFSLTVLCNLEAKCFF